jgi:hypothetical protein
MTRRSLEPSCETADVRRLQRGRHEVWGRLQHENGVMHVIAEDLVNRSAWLDHFAHLRGTLDSGELRLVSPL